MSKLISSKRISELYLFSVFKDGEIIWSEVNNLKVGDSICRYKEIGTNNSTIITNDSYDIILGMCLGDSSLLANKQVKKSYRLSTNHSIKQYDYMNLKKSIFEGISSYRNSLKSGYTGEAQCGFQTKSINISNEFYNSMYKESKKFISSGVNRWFTERTLAIWYMDDGSVSKSNGSVTFSTNSMSEEEVSILSSILKNKFKRYIDSLGVNLDLWLLLGDNAYDFGTDGDIQKNFFTIYQKLLCSFVS